MKLSEAVKEFVDLRSSKGPRSFKTAVRYEIQLRIFCLAMQDPELADIDLPHIIWYLNELERLGWKPAGRNLIAVALRKFFEYCNLRGYPVFNEVLIPLPEKRAQIPRVIDIESYRKLLDAIPVKTNNSHYIRNRALVMMIWDTGARSGEVCSLDDAELKFEKDMSGSTFILTEKSRGRKPIRQIFWTAETGKALKKWMKKKDELRELFAFKNPEATFISISRCPGLDVRGQRMNNRGVAEVMRVLSNKAELPYVANAHRARHAMGRDASQAHRANPFVVSNILGHSNLDSSQIYTVLWGNDLRNEWQQVIDKRGSLVQAKGKAPTHPQNFPALKNQTSTGGRSRGLARGITIKTSKYGRYVKA